MYYRDGMSISLPLVFAAILVCGLISSIQRVTIDVNPRAIMVGNAIRLRCRVPRDEHNRKLEMGVVDYVSSQYDLEGDAAPVTWERLITHMPCDVGPAYCAVQVDDGRWAIERQDLSVNGCEGH